MDKQITYAEAGVDIEEGAAAVDAIKDAVHSTYRPEVIGDIGGFGGPVQRGGVQGDGRSDHDLRNGRRGHQAQARAASGQA